MKRAIIFFCLLNLQLFLSLQVQAQKEYLKAKKLYENFEYQLAIPYYKDALAIDSTLESIEQIADCYRKTNQYKEALKYYKQALDIPYYNSSSVFYYAEMLYKTGDYTEAENQYTFYLNYEPANVDLINSRIKACKYAKELSNKPSSCIVENVKEINTKFAETGIAFSNNNLYFSSDRKAGNASMVDGWTGNAFYKIYTLPLKINNGKISFQRAKLFDANINKGYHAMSPTFSTDLTKMYYTFTELEKNPLKKHQVKSKDFTNKANINEARAKGKRWIYHSTIKNQESFYYSILHPCINADGTKLYFASDMPGGYGMFDLYYCTIENDSLSAPINLGNKINGPGMELYPSFANNEVLYFASDGHLGLGGLDNYMAKLKDTEVISIENLGFPINTSYDDFSYIFIESLKIGFFSSDREGGKGKDDVYKVIWSK